MKTTLLKNALIAATFLISVTVSAQLDLNFNADGDYEGATVPTAAGATSSVSGGLLIASNDGGANIQVRKNATNAGDSGEFKTVLIDVKNNSNADKLLIKKSNADMAEIAITSGDVTEKSYRIDIDNADWTGALQLRLQFVVDGDGELDANTIEINRIQVVDPTTLSVKENTLEGVAIYPNPVSSILNIKSPVGSDVAIYNVLGARVKNIKSISVLQDISVIDLKSGLYFVKITNGNKIFQHKMIKN